MTAGKSQAGSIIILKVRKNASESVCLASVILHLTQQCCKVASLDNHSQQPDLPQHDIHLTSRLRYLHKQAKHALFAMQTSYGRPLAIPMFILLAQNRHMLIRSVDKGVGDMVPPRPGQPVTPQPAESRVRTVCDRYDQMNKIMVQVRRLILLSLQQLPAPGQSVTAVTLPGLLVTPQPTGSRVRTCDHYGQMNKIMVQVRHPYFVVMAAACNMQCDTCIASRSTANIVQTSATHVCRLGRQQCIIFKSELQEYAPWSVTVLQTCVSMCWPWYSGGNAEALLHVDCEEQ